MGLSTDRMAGAAKNGANGTAHANGGPSSFAAKYDLPAHFIGGSHLGAAGPGKVKDFVAAHDGHTVITNVSFPNCTRFGGVAGSRADTSAFSAGAHCKQRYCSGQGNPIGAEVGIRDFWR
jgi:hypothetical protein